MTDPIAISLSAISIAASIWLTIETQMRRARMRITILRPPANWSVKLERPGSVPGVSFVANLEDAQRIRLAGTCPALIGNEGPKGGAVWDVRAQVNGLGTHWQLDGDILKPQPYTLAGKTYAGHDLPFALTCAITDLGNGIPGLEGTGPPMVTLGVVYNRHGWFGRVVSDHSEVSVDRAELLDAFRRGATANGVDLARVKLDPWIRGRIDEDFRKFGLSEPERNNLHHAAWMAAGPQASVLTYPITGEDGAAVLYFMEGWTGMAVAADGHRSTLTEVGDIHRALVQAVQERLGSRSVSA